MLLNQNTKLLPEFTPTFMSRTLYSPRLSDDVVRALYREGQRRGMPMTRLADALLRQALDPIPQVFPALHVCEADPDTTPLRVTGAA
jgi:hypothetical protein